MRLEAEQTSRPDPANAGGLQTLVPGVAPITMRQRLEWQMAQPLGPQRLQKSGDHGPFDLNARNQLALF